MISKEDRGWEMDGDLGMGPDCGCAEEGALGGWDMEVERSEVEG